MRDVTLLISHPDDEAIFLWPFLDRVKRIVCASSDQSNLSRKWCSERGKCLIEVAELLGCKTHISGANSEFYRAETRPVAKLYAHSARLIDELKGAEIIATHNAWGEYGHLDHILCHHIARTVQARTDCELLVTDIAVRGEPAWLPIAPWVQGHPKMIDIPGTSLRHKWLELDRALFDRIKAIYDARGCWTWSWEPVRRSRVYSL